MTKIVVIYVLLVNLTAYILYGADKQAAMEKKWRIPEKLLLLLPILGGSVGGILGMRVFHHKTRHWYFKYGLPFILLVQIGICVYLVNFR